MTIQNISVARFGIVKKALLIVGMAIFGLMLSGCSFLDGQRAGDYNEQIVALQKEILDKVDSITPMLSQQDIDIEALNTERQALSDLIKTNTQKLESVKKMEDDAGFYDATLEAFKGYQEFVDVEMAAYFGVVGEIMALDENATDAQYTELENKEQVAAENFEQALAKIDELENKAVEAQQAFAEKYNITLI